MAARDERNPMNKLPSNASLMLLAVLCWICGCTQHEPKPYGVEKTLALPGDRQQIWAVAPAINLSGQRQVDPLLQADLVFNQLQQVKGLTVIPVNRVIEVYSALQIEKIESPQQAALVCDLLGCDGLLVPTATFYDPYNPPKFGAVLQLFRKPSNYTRPPGDPRQWIQRTMPAVDSALSQEGDFTQAVGMYDAANGSVRKALDAYAAGRNDPNGPFQAAQYLVEMDRYCGFVYHELIIELLNLPRFGR